MDILHTALLVSDLEATEAFYVDALGLERTWEFVSPGDGATNIYVGGDNGTEFQFKHLPGEDVPEPAGIHHVAVSVENVDEALEYMVETTGCRVVRGPLQNDDIAMRVAFIEDPDGYVVELVQQLD